MYALHKNSADSVGDMFFDMLEVLPYPIACPNGTNTSHPANRGPNPCTNPEAGGGELMVNKLTLEVDTRYSDCEQRPPLLSLSRSLCLSLSLSLSLFFFCPGGCAPAVIQL
jgi:hypothetical protein